MLIQRSSIVDVDLRKLQEAAIELRWAQQSLAAARAAAQATGWDLGSWSRTPECAEGQDAQASCEDAFRTLLREVPTYLWQQPATKEFLTNSLRVDVCKYRP
jgi:hypothetical protein